MPKVGICTVNWNGKQDTLDFLQSLKTLDTSSLDIKVFVTDGGSTDGSVEAISSLPVYKSTSVQIIRKSQNRGSAGGYNDSAKEALKWGADYILLINNDTLIKDKNLLQELIKTMNSDPKIGLVTPKIYFAPGFEYQQDRGYKKTDQGNVLWYAGGSVDWANIGSHHRGIDEIDTGKYDIVEETGFTNGACVLVKKDVFDKGIFWDEGLFAYMDDNDFQEKVKRAGFKIYYDGQTSLFHKVSRTATIGSPFSDYMITRNRLIFGFRYASLRTKFALFRQALNFLISGRPMQKKGVVDFFLGKRGSLRT